MRHAAIIGLGAVAARVPGGPPPGLIAALDDDSPMIRSAAAMGLAHYGHGLDPAIPPLLRHLEDGERPGPRGLRRGAPPDPVAGGRPGRRAGSHRGPADPRPLRPGGPGDAAGAHQSRSPRSDPGADRDPARAGRPGHNGGRAGGQRCGAVAGPGRRGGPGAGRGRARHAPGRRGDGGLDRGRALRAGAAPDIGGRRPGRVRPGGRPGRAGPDRRVEGIPVRRDPQPCRRRGHPRWARSPRARPRPTSPSPR